MKTLFITVLSLVAITAAAYGDYTLTPQAGGDAGAIIGRGGTFTLDLVLTSDANDAHYASLFTVEFSVPGLIYNGHTWGSPYLTDGEDDWSEPANGDLPLALDADTFVNTPGFDPGTVDVWLENMVSVGSDIDPLDVPFTTGTLVSLSLTVPANYASPAVFVTVVPDTFDDGWGSISAIAGEMFILATEMEGDVDRSGYVDDDDLSLLLAGWGQNTDWNGGNLNGDTIVNDDDLSLLLASWNEGTPPPPPAASVPEPAMMILLVAGAPVLLRRRKA